MVIQVHTSGRFLNWLTDLRTLERALALPLTLPGKRICGIFVFEATWHGARMTNAGRLLHRASREPSQIGTGGECP